ncbi:MAG: type 4a pilus biogenesis protein PilO [Terriglobia bacterium]
MALRFRELPWIVQTLIFLGLAVAIGVAGEMAPYSPVKEQSDVRTQKEGELERLTGEVAVLKQVEARYRRFKSDVEALENALEISKLIVPDEKRTDDFIRSVQEAALNSQVAIRRLTAKPVVVSQEQGYAVMPIEVEIDGAYYSLREFYFRLSRLERVVDVGELKLDGLEAKVAGTRKYEYAPGTSVAGTCVLTTYYWASPAEVAAAAPVGRGARGRAPAAGRPPR